MTKSKRLQHNQREYYARIVLMLMLWGVVLGIAILYAPSLAVVFVPPLTPFSGYLFSAMQLMWLPCYLCWRKELQQTAWRRCFQPLILLVLVGFALTIGGYMQTALLDLQCFDGGVCTRNYGLLLLVQSYYDALPFTPLMLLQS
jgi:hypothetical protein